jgi:NAD+ kinase
VASIALVVHPDREDSVALARELATWLETRGHEVRVPAEDAQRAGLTSLAFPADDLAIGLDLAVSLGGDGTMLHTVRLVVHEDVPVLGVNVGNLGYLTEVEPHGAQVALKRFLSGSFQIEERMLLEVECDAPSLEGVHPLALNEAVVEKIGSGHTVHLEVTIDGQPFTTYAADGLIVATPTGSTAYAFSARGPIVSPEHKAMLLTPVSPHMLFDRTLVLDPTRAVELRVVDGHSAALSVDGRELGQLGPGTRIRCTASSHVARLVVFGPRDFLRILKVKFGLADR